MIGWPFIILTSAFAAEVGDMTDRPEGARIVAPGRQSDIWLLICAIVYLVIATMVDQWILELILVAGSEYCFGLAVERLEPDALGRDDG